jgi:hypothetical protein
LAQADVVLTEPLAIIIDDGRNDARTAGQRRDPRNMIDPVLQDRNPRRRIAQPRQPRRDQGCLLDLGAEKNPIDARSLCWVHEGPQRHLNASFRLFEHQPLDRMPDAGDDVMPIGDAQASRRDTSDASKTNDSDGRAVLMG